MAITDVTGINVVLEQAGLRPYFKLQSCSQENQKCVLEIRNPNQPKSDPQIEELPDLESLWKKINEWRLLNQKKAALFNHATLQSAYTSKPETYISVDVDGDGETDGGLFHRYQSQYHDFLTSPVYHKLSSPSDQNILYDWAWNYIATDLNPASMDTSTYAWLMRVMTARPMPDRNTPHYLDLGDWVRVARQNKEPVGLTVMGALMDQTWQNMGLSFPNARQFLTDNNGLFQGLYDIDEKDGDKPIDPRVSLRLSGTNQVIPWTDPMLRLDWESYMSSLPGVEVNETTYTPSADQKRQYRGYFYKGLPFMLVEKTEGEITYRGITPYGKIEWQQTFGFPPPPPVQVTPPNESSDLYTVTVHGHEIQVRLQVTPEQIQNDPKGPEQAVKNLGDFLQRFSRNRLAPLLRGQGNEPPLVIDWNLTPEGNKILGLFPVTGYYNPITNTSVVGVTFLGMNLRGHIIHELLGHGADDYEKDDVGPYPNFLTNPEASALRAYFYYRLTQCFTPGELAEYKTLSAADKSILPDWFKETPQDSEKTQERLQNYRDRAQRFFVTQYAIEGPLGLEKHRMFPVEYFAEMEEAVLSALFEESYGWGSAWIDVQNLDPAFKLFKMRHYFLEYPKVEQINGVKRGENFNRSAFEAVLGFHVDNIDFEAYRTAGIASDDRSAGEGWALRLSGGFSHASGHDTGPTFGAGLHHVWSDPSGFRFGTGLFIDNRSFSDQQSWDMKLRSNLGIPAFAMGDLGPFSVNIGLSGGIRRSTSAESGSFNGVGELAAGPSIFGDGLGAEYKLTADSRQTNNFEHGLSIYFDPVSFYRWARTYAPALVVLLP